MLQVPVCFLKVWLFFGPHFFYISRWREPHRPVLKIANRLWVFWNHSSIPALRPNVFMADIKDKDRLFRAESAKDFIPGRAPRDIGKPNVPKALKGRKHMNTYRRLAG